MACRDCGSARLEPIPKETRDLYGMDYFEGGTVAGGYSNYGADEGLHRRNAHARLDLIRARGVAPPGRIVELGTGYGFFLDEARSAGWDVAGVDISDHARAAAGALDLPIADSLNAIPGEADVFAAFQVLEHLRYPFEALADGIKLLKPGAAVVVETWDRTHRIARLTGRHWQQVSPPAVIHLFSSAGLRTMAARAGLTKIDISSSTKAVSVAAVAGQLASQHPRWERTFRRLRDSRFAQRPLEYGFGDLITLTARKPVKRAQTLATAQG